MMDDIALMRALHVLAIIHWVGGLGFVTLVVLPLAGTRATMAEALSLFEIVERRFSAQVRLSVPLAGLTGLWMSWRLELWDRFVDPAYWWMAAMAGLWAVFMLMLFVIEPLLHARVAARARAHPGATLRLISRLHCGLLALAALTAFGAVGGAHGLFIL